VDADEDLRHSRAEDKPLNGRIDHLTELHAAKTSFVVQSLIKHRTISSKSLFGPAIRLLIFLTLSRSKIN